MKMMIHKGDEVDECKFIDFETIFDSCILPVLSPYKDADEK